MAMKDLINKEEAKEEIHLVSNNPLTKINDKNELGVDLEVSNRLVNSSNPTTEQQKRNTAEAIGASIDLVETAVEKTVSYAIDKAVSTGKATGVAVAASIDLVEDAVKKSVNTAIMMGDTAIHLAGAVLDHNIDKIFNKDSSNSSNVKKVDTKTLVPKDHTAGYTDPSVIKDRNEVNDYFVEKVIDHFTYDANDPTTKDSYKINSDKTAKFTGSTTLVNPPVSFWSDIADHENYDAKKEIMETGLYEFEKKENGDDEPTLSPLKPFTQMDPDLAHKAIFSSYNRTQIPVADVEFRKGFKHIMFSRPECYVMCSPTELCEQVKNDLDFTSTFSRLPHLLKLLAPVYITGSFSPNNINSNWNYLLCNRIISINDDFKTSIGVNENVVKSIEGHTIAPGKTLESTQGGSISITFRDTKNLEVYEFLRLWMLYIHKLRKGIFAPSYNGYQYSNDFVSPYTTVSNYSIILHPYDRALDYTASIFQFITNESMSKIITWQKWYGIYPIDASISGLNGSDSGSGITSEVTVSATFHYQKKEVNNNRTLVEFNYNAGLTNDLGSARDVDFYQAASNKVVDTWTEQYMGPVDMFTGTPYVVLAKGPKDPLSNDNSQTLVPYLKFSAIDKAKNYKMINIANSSLSTPTDSSMERNLGEIIGTY